MKIFKLKFSFLLPILIILLYSSFLYADSCHGCDCSFDTLANDSSPGVIIDALDGTTQSVSSCISGESENNDKDYYNFTVQTSGTIHIVTSSPNSHDNHMEIVSNFQGTLLSYDTNRNRDLTYTLSANERLTILIKETGNDLDEYEINFTFEKIINADDLCYVDPITTEGACFNAGMVSFGFNCTKTIVIKSSEDITDVQAAIDTSGMFSANLMNDCGIDGISEKDSGRCKNNSSIDTGPFSFMESGIDYNITQTMAEDSNHSIYNNALIDMSFFSSDKLYGSYRKNGELYYGKLKKCAEGSCKNLSFGDRPFTIRNPENTRNIYGNYTIGGNINLCTDKDGDGVCNDETLTYSNSYKSVYVDIDGDNTTVNSSSFTLDINSSSEVVWAGLYWQGTIHNSNNDNDRRDEDFGRDNLWVEGNKVVDATNVDSSHKQIDLLSENNGHGAYGACRVKFKVPGKGYVEISADQLDYYELGYGAFADVTEQLNATSPNGVYTVADIKSQINKETSHGNYAAWSLVVIYKNANEKYRNISLFDGFVTVDGNYDGNLIMSGFLTPQAPPINSKLAFFTMDGDNGSNSLEIINESGTSTMVVDPDYPDDSLFNSSIENTIARTPSDIPSARLDLDIIDLVDVLGPSNHEATLKPRSGGDRYTASYFIMSAELRTIDLCYDYTYGQNNRFITAGNIDDPEIDGDFDKSKKLDIKLYFENRENSDVQITNLHVDIDPINTDEAIYDRNSTYITSVDGVRSHVDDVGRDVADTKNNNIAIGGVGSLQNFYVYYGLSFDASDSDGNTLDGRISKMPINATLNFNLNIQGIDLGSATMPIKDMEICQASSAYSPTPGLFNVVHNSEVNPNLSTGYYLNLPTQVVKRVGNFKAVSMEPRDINTIRVKPINTAVAVEMLDVSGFHYATATCNDQDVRVISDRVWVNFDNTSSVASINKTDMSNAGFFDTALNNAAFRLSYNTTDNDGNIYEAKNNAGSNDIEWREEWAGKNCRVDMSRSKYGNGQNTVASYCNFTGGSHDDIAACMECIYGVHTKNLCSRDNFAIRPESFQVQLSDYNHSDGSNKTHLVDNSTASSVDLAAGYDYMIDINATDHLNTLNVAGYDTSAVDINISWAPTNSVVCNDDSSHIVNTTFYNGATSVSTALDQVGKYSLQIRDTKWSRVDYDSSFTTHHVSPLFRTTPDCIENSDIVNADNMSNQNGCTISSNHTNTQNTKEFYDIGLIYHPYSFSITPSIKLGLNSLAALSNSNIYMSDISSDENMSVQINTDISAVGKNNPSLALSNFTKSCYAKPIKITLNKSAAQNTALNYKYKFNDFNASNSVVHSQSVQTIAYNANPSITTDSTYFEDTKVGVLSTVIKANFDRKINVVSNPENINFISYRVVDNANTFNADLNTNKIADANISLNKSIKHYYARTHASRQRYEGATGTANIYYEVYCFGVTNGNTCDKTLLPQGLNSKRTDDIRWYVNTAHTANEGNAGKVTQRSSTVHVTSAGSTTGNHPDNSTLMTYDENEGYPYKTTMQNNASKWLIYNPDNPTATRNSFSVEFEKNGAIWSGSHDTNTTTKDPATVKSNRRSMW